MFDIVRAIKRSNEQWNVYQVLLQRMKFVDGFKSALRTEVAATRKENVILTGVKKTCYERPEFAFVTSVDEKFAK